MGVTDVYPPTFLNVEYVTAHGLWNKELKIVKTEVRTLPRGESTIRRLVVTLDGVSVPLLLNRTNAKTLAKAWGDNYETWIGKTLKLVQKLVMYKNEEVPAIRVEPVG